MKQNHKFIPVFPFFQSQRRTRHGFFCWVLLTTAQVIFEHRRVSFFTTARIDFWQFDLASDFFQHRAAQ